MKVRTLFLIAAVAAGIYAYTTWPPTDGVESGKTPEYPDIRVHDYGASPENVAKGVKAILHRLPGWSLVGEGKGPGGAELQALHATPLGLLKDDVQIRIRRDKGRTTVSVKAKSRLGSFDFGQSARDVRELLDTLDHEVF